MIANDQGAIIQQPDRYEGYIRKVQPQHLSASSDLKSVQMEMMSFYRQPSPFMFVVHPNAPVAEQVHADRSVAPLMNPPQVDSKPFRQKVSVFQRPLKMLTGN